MAEVSRSNPYTRKTPTRSAARDGLGSSGRDPRTTGGPASRRSASGSDEHGAESRKPQGGSTRRRRMRGHGRDQRPSELGTHGSGGRANAHDGRQGSESRV